MRLQVEARVTAAFGIAGVAVTLAGFLVAAAGFQGLAGEGYSLLNHFVSELGVTSISQAGVAFNIGLIGGGACFLAFIWMARDVIRTRAGVTLGIIAAVGCLLVGVFPAEPGLLLYHAVAAFTFFFGGMLAVLAFTIAIIKGKGVVLPKAFAIPGLVVVAIYVAFLVEVFGSMAAGGGSNLVSFEDFMLDRPAFVASAFLEWLAVLGINAWLLALAAGTWRVAPPRQA